MPKGTKRSVAPSKKSALIPINAGISSSWFAKNEGILPRSSITTWYSCWRWNADVMRAVGIIGQTAAKDGVRVMREDADGTKSEVEDIPEVEALMDSFKLHKQEIITAAIVGGNAYIVKLRNDNGEFGGKPVGMKVLDPRQVTVYMDENGAPVKYRYLDTHFRRGATVDYIPEDVIHWAPITDPDRPPMGVSPIESVVPDALADDKAALMNYVFFDNNGLPDSIVKVDSSLTKEQHELMTEWLGKMNGSAEKKGKSMVSSSIEDVIQLNQNRKDAQFPELRKIATEKVCAAIGVPKAVLNYTGDVNYATAGQQYTQFIENTIRPVERALEEILERILFEIDPTLEVEISDEHTDDSEQRQKIASANVTAGIITPNEAREEQGYDPLDIEGMDIPKGMAQAAPPEPQPNAAADEEEIQPAA